MGYTIPIFPLVCNIYTGPWLTKVLRGTAVPCNLGQGKRIMFWGGDWAGIGGTNEAQLLLPPGTDIRPAYFNAGQQDLVEVPAGSSRWYQVQGVDDIGKGFDNEHRFALIAPVDELFMGPPFAGCRWPIPIP